MARYVDGFVIPVPRKKLGAYLRIARKAARIWREYGAVEYRECVGDDLRTKMGTSFPRGIRTRPGETVVFSWIVYRSRAQRDQANAKIMNDPRLAALCDPQNMPFDAKRMLSGGFETRVGF
jgi:uncharacterized protein YbaA (DUF1428 family)